MATTLRTMLGLEKSGSSADTSGEVEKEKPDERSSVSSEALDKSVSEYKVKGLRSQLKTTPVTLYGSEPIQGQGSQIGASEGLVAYAIKGGKVRVLNRNSMSRALLRGLDTTIIDLALAPRSTRNESLKETRLCAVGDDGRAIVWKIEYSDLATSSDVELVSEVIHEVKSNDVKRIAWKPSGNKQVLAYCAGTSLCVLDVDAPSDTSITWSATAKDSICDLDWNATGELILTCSKQNGAVALWHPGLNTPFASFQDATTEINRFQARWDRVGRIVCLRDDATLSLWDGSLQHRLRLTGIDSTESARLALPRTTNALLETKNNPKPDDASLGSALDFVFVTRGLSLLIFRLGTDAFDYVTCFSQSHTILSFLALAAPLDKSRYHEDPEVEDETSGSESHIFVVQPKAIHYFHFRPSTLLKQPDAPTQTTGDDIRPPAPSTSLLPTTTPKTEPLPSLPLPSLSDPGKKKATLPSPNMSSFEPTTEKKQVGVTTQVQYPVHMQQQQQQAALLPQAPPPRLHPPVPVSATVPVPQPRVLSAQNNRGQLPPPLMQQQPFHHGMQQQQQQPPVRYPPRPENIHMENALLQRELSAVTARAVESASRAVAAQFAASAEASRRDQQATLARLEARLDRLEKSLDATIQTAHQAAIITFKQTLVEHLVPAVQAATTNCFDQMSAALSRRLAEHDKIEIERLAQFDKSWNSIAIQISENLRQSLLSAGVQGQALSTTNTNSNINISPPAHRDIREDIKELIHTDNDIDGALYRAVEGRDVDILLFALQEIGIHTVQNISPNPIQPLTLLCIIQQLGTTLDQAEHIDLIPTKLDWLQFAVLALDPNSPAISAHVPEVLKQVKSALEVLPPQLTTSSTLQIINHVINSLLK